MKLSLAMSKCLLDVRDAGDFQASCKGRAEHGGRFQVAKALESRGLLKRRKGWEFELTPDGMKAAEEMEGRL